MTDFTPLQYMSLEETEFVDPNYGDSVRMQKAPDPRYPTPKHHYLISVCQTPGGLDVRRMWDHDIGPIDISEQMLFHKSKGPDPTPAYLGRGFRGMVWKYPCYISIILDNPDFEFIFDRDINNREGDPVTFLETSRGTQFHENYSFYNAEPIIVPILDPRGNPTGDQRHGIRFQNFIKADRAGADLRLGEERRYKFNINIWEPVIGGGRVPRYTDPDGQNQGPPGVP